MVGDGVIGTGTEGHPRGDGGPATNHRILSISVVQKIRYGLGARMPKGTDLQANWRPNNS